MKSWWKVWSLACSVSGSFLVSAVPAAAAPIPQVTVTALSGQVVRSDQIPHAARWVLIYLIPGCAPCEVALQALGQQEALTEGPRIVVLVQGSVEEATALRATMPELEGAGWYTDPEGAAFDRLGLAGVPTTIGVRAQNMIWRVSGTLGDAQKWRAIVQSWLALRTP